jgi:hypothetical protein
MDCAAASDSPCCSSRSTLKSSATIGSEASASLRAGLEMLIGRSS